MSEIDTRQREVVSEFSLFPDWLDRYQYLIDLGRKLPPLDAGELNDGNLLDGCQSRVWLVTEGNRERLDIRANSDAAIVSGLIALLIRVYSGAAPGEILDSKPKFIEDLGLAQHLSPTRANGLHAMLTAINHAAREALA
ncbi:MAG: SufE family protein [Xanthomonadales bacterium]|nr:SufE family protein [Gammaproteobacteria bacterium]NNE04818.1 SufE family protein [Xanthomonadales bacterium]NNL94643.1 SufE family protein [Xanthomonadales bacterium]